MTNPQLGNFQQTSANWRAVLKKNQRNTILVMLGFVCIYLSLGLLIDVALYSDQYPNQDLWSIFLELLSGRLWPIATIVAGGIAIFSIAITFLFHRKLVLLGTKYQQVNAQSTDPQLQKLYNLVEEMKIAAGMPFMPKIYLIDAPYMNAFASGYNEKSALIAVTKGLFEKLNRAELQAVIAHELSHIRHLDIRLTLMASVLSNLILILCDIIFWSAYIGGKDSSNSKSGNNIFLIILIFRYLLPLITLILMLFLSRTREYMADAGCVELMRDNQPLASALLKINQDHIDSKESHQEAYEKTAHEAIRREAYIYDPKKANISMKHSITDFFSTHPGIMKRLSAIGYKKKPKT